MNELLIAKEHARTTGFQFGIAISGFLCAFSTIKNGWPPLAHVFAYIVLFYTVRAVVYVLIYWLVVFGTGAGVPEPAPVVEKPRPQLPVRPQRPAQSPGPEVTRTESVSPFSPQYPEFPFGDDVRDNLTSWLGQNLKVTITGRQMERAGVLKRDPRLGDVTASDVIDWMNVNGFLRFLGNHTYVLSEYGDGWVLNHSPHPSPEAVPCAT